MSGCTPYKECRKRDKGLFADVRYFQLKRVNIPWDVENRHLRNLVIAEEAVTELFHQEAQIVSKETEAKVCIGYNLEVY